MKFPVFTLPVFLLATVLFCAAEPAPRPPPQAQPPASQTGVPELDALLPDTFVTAVVDAGYIDAFAKRSSSTPVKEMPRTAGPDTATVRKALSNLKLSGVMPTADNCSGLIIAGGEIYRIGDEITVAKKGSQSEPLLKDCVVKLASVSASSIGLLVAPSDPPAAAVTVSINVADVMK